MKINKIRHVISDKPIKFYDVINCYPYNNFPILCNGNKQQKETNNCFVISHNCAMLDEADFSRGSIKGSSALDVKNEIMRTYNAIKERMNSRFIKNGVQYGRLFLVSSKKSDQDFIEAYIKKMKAEHQDKHMLIIDEPQWVIKPEGTYSKQKFPVAVGNRSLKSMILPDNLKPEEEDAYRKQGYQILWVPINFKQSFILDVNTALMNLAGISVVGTTTFFNYDMFSKCYVNNYKNPFVADVLTIGLNDDLNIAQFFEIDKIPLAVRSMPQFIHIDGALTGDKAGISDVGVSGLKETVQYNGAEEFVSGEMTYKHIFSVDIKAPNGSEISFEKTRQFIYYLRQCGFNIVGVSLDGFQSADTKQILITQGFDATIVSLDKSPQGYLTLRSAMNDGRLGLIQIPLLEKELIELQRDVQTGKIDHPEEGCFTEDTKIALVDGRTLTIHDLLLEQEYKDNYVYTINESTHEIEPKRIKKVFQTKLVTTLLEVTLDNGEIIHCTPEHRFMLREVTYKEANILQNTDCLKSIGTENIHIKQSLTKRYNDTIPVYDLEIEDNHNFALAAGVFVHNSKDMSDSLAGALYNATLHKQELVDSLQLLSSAIEVNDEMTAEQEFISDMENSMRYQQSKQAEDKLNDLFGSLGGYNDPNVISW